MSTNPSYSPQFEEELEKCHETLYGIDSSISTRIVGQEMLRRRLVQALLTNGHVLLEGVPGLAKTLSIKALAESVEGDFQRIQFTPDLLPADIIGTEIYQPQTGEFCIRTGPVFTNFLLADEINRSPAKVQSALLETMQERQVTIGEKTHTLPKPFFVLATQNPVEQEGTYSLPEAQIDRFIIKVKVDYPTKENEKEILNRVSSNNWGKPITPVASLSAIISAQEVCKKIYVDDRIKDYIVNLVQATRNPKEFGLDIHPLIELGASPRATLSMMSMAQTEALLSKEHFVVPQNVKDIALDVLRHRVIPTYEAEARGYSTEDLVQTIIESVEVP